MRHPPPFLLYICGVLGAAIHKFSPLVQPLSFSLHLLPPALLSEAPPDHHKLHHHHAAVLLLELLPQPLLPPCWIKALEKSPGCTCVERGGTVVRC